MSKLIMYIVLTAIFSSAALASEKTSLSYNTLPTVSIFHAAMFDKICATKTSYKIDSAWENELHNSTPNWKKLWSQDETLLMVTTTKLIGRPFIQQNFQVALSLCNFPSMSAPLIVNTRYALHSFTTVNG